MFRRWRRGRACGRRTLKRREKTAQLIEDRIFSAPAAIAADDNINNPDEGPGYRGFCTSSTKVPSTSFVLGWSEKHWSGLFAWVEENLPTSSNGRWLLFSIIIVAITINGECVHSWMRRSTYGWTDAWAHFFFLRLFSGSRGILQ